MHAQTERGHASGKPSSRCRCGTEATRPSSISVTASSGLLSRYTCNQFALLSAIPRLALYTTNSTSSLSVSRCVAEASCSLEHMRTMAQQCLRHECQPSSTLVLRCQMTDCSGQGQPAMALRALFKPTYFPAAAHVHPDGGSARSQDEHMPLHVVSVLPQISRSASGRA